MALDLPATLSGLGARLSLLSGLRVYNYPPDKVAPPAAIVGLPSQVDYDATMGRGLDRMVIPIIVLVGKVSDRASRAAIAAYVSGTGASSIKATIEGDSTLAGVVDSVAVTTARIDVVTMNGIDYMGAEFDAEVYS